MLTPEVSRAGAVAVNATEDYTESEKLRDVLIALDGKPETIGRDQLAPQLRATLGLSSPDLHAQPQSPTPPLNQAETMAKPPNAIPIALARPGGDTTAEVVAGIVSLADSIIGTSATDEDISDALRDYGEPDTSENVAAVRSALSRND
ncbi:hypothetical protein AB4Y72_14990 [Arthrobacter sp. YAF34]|uniref:hypothetical protein n=1 Tax=Arthrobacter sp. YAF34 TaxID=3233083 RepID=UPI003F90D361